MPFSTRWSSTRGTPRTFVGSRGAITDHSKSVRLKRAIMNLQKRRSVNQNEHAKGIPFMGMSPSALALLFNCSRPEVMRQALEVAATAIAEAGRPVEIGVYANAFAFDDGGAANETLHAIRDDLSAENYASFACDWTDSGATMVGGCCGVGALHIHRLCQRLRCPAGDRARSIC